MGILSCIIKTEKLSSLEELNHKAYLSIAERKRKATLIQLEVFEKREQSEYYQKCMGGYLSAYMELKKKGR